MNCLLKIISKRFCKRTDVSILNENSSINFQAICQLFNNLEQQSSFIEKKKMFSSVLIKYIHNINQNEENKIEFFKNVSSIIKCSIPYLNLIQTKIPFRDKMQPNEENLRNMYTYDLLLRNYIKENFQLSMQEISKDSIKYGDLAKYLVHLMTVKNFRESVSNLSIEEVIEYKERLIKTIGNKSSLEKIQILSELISKCGSLIEILYVGRILTNRLKIGVAEKNIIKVLIEMQSYFKKKKVFEEFIKYLEENVFGYQIYYPIKLLPANSNEIDGISDFYFTLKPGTFVDLQLGRPGMDLRTFLDTIQRNTQNIIIETKYDGERSQIHFDGKQIIMGSRALQDQSPLYETLKNSIFEDLIKYNKMYPDTRIKNFILDGEIVSYSIKNKTFSNFQELRKKENVSDSKEYQYYFIVFDILYLNNQNLFDLQIEKRKTILFTYFYNKMNKILVERGVYVSLENTKKASEIIIKYFKKAKSINCEGLIAKELGKDSSYQFGKRRWYKIKSLQDETQDTLDLVPIAGFLGKGKSLMYSFLMASYDKHTNKYYSLCKIGTGFDQDDLMNIHDRFKNSMLTNMPENYVIPNHMRPRFFFKPLEVWEVGFDSISESHFYPIGKEESPNEKGISLRFPRFIRLRTDKSFLQANSPNEILKYFVNKNESSLY